MSIIFTADHEKYINLIKIFGGVKFDKSGFCGNMNKIELDKEGDGVLKLKIIMIDIFNSYSIGAKLNISKGIAGGKTPFSLYDEDGVILFSFNGKTF
jgi:hypothetical protein